METILRILLITGFATITACGGCGRNPAGKNDGGEQPGPRSYSIGGTVSGLAGSGLVLRNNGGDDLPIAANGPFTLVTGLQDGDTYAVTVLSQPHGLSQVCMVMNGQGTVSGADVTTVAINCSTNTYKIGGTVSGLAGSGFVLQNNGGDDFAIAADGSFTFPTALADGSAFSVSVKSQPQALSQTCTVANGSGTFSGADISTVSITCATNSYKVGGTVTGLAGSGLVLQNNGGDDLAIGSDGAFAFPTPLVDGSGYFVSVKAEPTNLSQLCIVQSNYSGILAGANVTNVSVACITNNFTIGGTVSGLAGLGLVLDNGGREKLPILAHGSFTFVLPLPDGSSYSVSILKQPKNHTCTVANASGTLAGANVTNVVVTCVGPVPRFAYVANFNDNTISTYTVNAATGQLRHSGYVDAGTSPNAVVVDPSGKFLYAASFGSSNLSAYTIDPGNGALTPVAGSPFAVGAGPVSVAVHPSGKYLLAVCQMASQNLAVFAIGPTGALTFVTSLKVDTSPLSKPNSVAFDPSGKFAYVADYGTDRIPAFTFNGATGALAPVAGSPFAAGGLPFSVIVDPSGRFAYVANNFNGAGGNSVSAYTIDPTTGALTPIPGSPFQAGSAPTSVAVDALGRFAYVASSGSGQSLILAIDPNTGALGAPALSPSAGGTPRSVTVDPSGKFLYQTSPGLNEIWAYGIDSATGGLSWWYGGVPRIAARNWPVAMTIVGGPKPVTYTPKLAYVANTNGGNTNGSVLGFTIATTGALTAVAGTPLASGWNTQGLATDLAGRFLYIANYNSTLTGFSIGASGSLAAIAGSPFPAPASQWAWSAAVDPSGRFAYYANYNNGGAGGVSAFTLNATSGALTGIAGSPFPAGNGPVSIGVDPTGRFAYVANTFSNDVSAYGIASPSGVLTPIDANPAVAGIQNFAAGSFTGSVTFHPTGRFVYVLNSGVDTISGYTIGATTGALTQMDANPAVAGIQDFAAPAGYAMAIEPSGRFAYVTKVRGFNALMVYTIDGNSGALTATGASIGTGTNPNSVTIDASGTFLVVGNAGSNNVSMYAINAGTGALTAVAGSPFPAGTGPVGVATTCTIQ